jgi:hypothetical protein
MMDAASSMTFPEAYAIETWLKSLCTADGAGEGGRTLFILDNDFGELTTVMYLILGQECFGDARILLSHRLYEKNHDVLPGRTGVWNSEQDLVEKIETLRPRVVVFASGYVLPVHKLLTADAMDRLCALAQRHNAVVVTADPFLGLISQWSGRGLDQLISIDIPKNAGEHLVAVKRAADAMLHAALSKAEKVLRTLPHLYPSFTDMDALETATTDGRNVSFFNDALVLPPDINVTATTAGRASHWMFVISEVDYQIQMMFMGNIEFARVVASLLTQTVQLDRHAIFAGPAELLDLLKPALADNERIHLLTFCSFPRFMSLLLSAEYSFYWNVVSHTILMQLWNGRPVVLFNRGHLARSVPALYERVIAWYYQGWEPPYLDHNAALSLSALEEAVAPHAQHRNQIMARFRRAQSPATLFASLR